MSTLPFFEHFLRVGNLKPNLEWFFKQKLKPSLFYSIGPQRNHECNECGHRFSQKASLVLHTQTIHMKMRRHVCDECGFAFSQKHSLKLHKDGVHLKNRRFKCEQCGSAFARKHHLTQHNQNVHQKQGEIQ